MNFRDGLNPVLVGFRLDFYPFGQDPSQRGAHNCVGKDDLITFFKFWEKSQNLTFIKSKLETDLFWC